MTKESMRLGELRAGDGSALWVDCPYCIALDHSTGAVYTQFQGAVDDVCRFRFKIISDREIRCLLST